jgi:hypothetical protein
MFRLYMSYDFLSWSHKQEDFLRMLKWAEKSFINPKRSSVDCRDTVSTVEKYKLEVTWVTSSGLAFFSFCLQQILKGLLHIVYHILPCICFSKFKSCVTQEDVFLGTLTVRETITYSAHLRLSRKMTKDEIYSVVKHYN